MSESDPFLRRLEYSAVVACGVLAVLALVIQRGRPGGAAGVVAGGLLAAISYRGIKSGMDALVVAVSGAGLSRGRVVFGLVKFFTRFGILAGAAYVIIVRLRLHPVAVLVGASALVAAAAVEAVRGLGRRRPDNPR